MKGTIVIPTYNEKENIEKTIFEVTKVLEHVKTSDFGILIVDDSSPDGTGEIVKKIIETNSLVTLHTRTKKEGLGAAYLDGIDFAFQKLGAQAVIQFDADLSHPPEILPYFIEQLEKDFDLVVGTRYRKGGSIPSNWAPHRKLLSFGGNLFVRTMFMDSRVTDWTAGFKGISKEIFYKCKDKVKDMSGYTFQASFTKSAIDSGASVTEIPYHFTDRVFGKSKMGMDYIKDMLYFVIRTRAKEVLESRFGKVFIAGGIGMLFQLSSYALIIRNLVVEKNIFNLATHLNFFGFDIFLPLTLATLIAIEAGIIATFLINNKWAFKDSSKNDLFTILKGIIKVNIVASGAILIQLGIVAIAESLFGSTLFIDLIFQAFGVLIGLIWNFYFYKKFVWRVT